VVLGFNCADDQKIAQKLLHDLGITFPNVLDASEEALAVAHKYAMSGVPLTYLIDREGKVVESWYGFNEGDHRGLESLAKLGVKKLDQDDKR
jgi:peroxiredoxin